MPVAGMLQYCGSNRQTEAWGVSGLIKLLSLGVKLLPLKTFKNDVVPAGQGDVDHLRPHDKIITTDENTERVVGGHKHDPHGGCEYVRITGRETEISPTWKESRRWLTRVLGTPGIDNYTALELLPLIHKRNDPMRFSPSASVSLLRLFKISITSISNRRASSALRAFFFKVLLRNLVSFVYILIYPSALHICLFCELHRQTLSMWRNIMGLTVPQRKSSSPRPPPLWGPHLTCTAQDVSWDSSWEVWHSNKLQKGYKFIRI